MVKKSPRVLLLVDWSPKIGSSLLDLLHNCGLNCDILGADFHESKWTPLNKVISHWPRCFWVSMKAFKRRNDYDYVLAWQQTMGMLLGMFKLVTCSHAPKVFILDALIIERENIFMEMFRKWFIATSWKKVDQIAFISNAYRKKMQATFKVPDSKAVHLKLPFYFETIPEFRGFKADSYLYSVGLSYRDYKTLMIAADKIGKPFAIATNDTYLKGLHIPKNVTIHRNTFGKAAEELMKQAAAVILPLEKITSPAGEATLISAMCYGKPVIITQTITTGEYISHGENGLLVPAHDPDAILDAVKFLFDNPEKADAIARSARQTVLKNHTMEVYAKNIIEIIQNNINENQLH